MFELAVVLVVKLNKEWKEKDGLGCYGEFPQIKTLVNKKLGHRRRKLIQVDQPNHFWETSAKQHNELDGKARSIKKYRGNCITSSRTNMIDFSSLAIFLFAYFIFNLGYCCHYMK